MKCTTATRALMWEYCTERDTLAHWTSRNSCACALYKFIIYITLLILNLSEIFHVYLVDRLYSASWG